MARKPSPDRAYLVRCWHGGEDAPGGAPRWRFSVEEVLHERRRRGFADLASLLAYLHAELGGDGGQSSDRA